MFQDKIVEVDIERFSQMAEQNGAQDVRISIARGIIGSALKGTSYGIDRAAAEIVFVHVLGGDPEDIAKKEPQA